MGDHVGENKARLSEIHEELAKQKQENEENVMAKIAETKEQTNELEKEVKEIKTVCEEKVAYKVECNELKELIDQLEEKTEEQERKEEEHNTKNEEARA